MSADFIKMISEIHSQRYAVRMNNLVTNKIPCGIFCGLTRPANIDEIVNALKNSGLNITCLCTIDNTYQMGGVRQVCQL